MAQPRHAPAQPFFLKTVDGERFCLFHPPVDACRGALLYLHPFAEEMNRTRRLAAQQARLLAARGIGVLQIDLHGCGDSSGDFGDARWERWLADVALGCTWLQDRLGYTPGLWGARLGALLALDYAHQAPHAPARLLLWQPVLIGKQALTQFLRLRVAGDMLAETPGASGGTEALRAQLQSGRALEVAGYEIAPQLAATIDGLDAALLTVPGCPMHWFEVTGAAERPLPPAAARVAERWRAHGVDLRLELVPSFQFWATQETAGCPALLAATQAVFEEACDAL